MEGQGGEVAEPAQRPVAVAGEDGVGGVLDHEQVVAPGDLEDRVHVAAHAGVVDRHDRPGPGRDGRLDHRLVDVQRVGPDVHEDGRGAPEDEGVGRRHEGEGRHDDLVAGPDPAEDGRHLESRRAGMGEERLATADPLLEPAGAALRERAVAGKMAVRVGLLDVTELVAGEERPVERDHRARRYPALLGPVERLGRFRPC